MNYLGNNPITRTVLAALTLGVLSVGIISLATMNHDTMMTSQNCPISVNGGDCSQPKESNVCIDYHLGIIQNLSNIIPQSFGVQLLGLMLVALLTLAVFGSLDSVYRFYCRLKIRFKQLLEETLEVFQNQLGFWLTIVQKRDPSYAFALV